jgi:hypothetical protein
LPRCERVAIDDDRWLAAKAFVVDEGRWRENVCRARRRLRVAAVATARTLIKQNGCARYELDIEDRATASDAPIEKRMKARNTRKLNAPDSEDLFFRMGM